jgi:phosphohistidine phosphatase
MATLYLLRHAKSSWDDLDLHDHERPLAPRGVKAAGLMGSHIRSSGVAPALVLCSTATRARETLERLELDAPIELEDGLYGASEGELLERLRRLPASLESAMLIGHNPSIQELTLMLAREGEGLARIHEKFPTGALATLEFEGDWSALAPHCALLVGFVRPKELG